MRTNLAPQKTEGAWSGWRLNCICQENMWQYELAICINSSGIVIFPVWSAVADPSKFGGRGPLPPNFNPGTSASINPSGMDQDEENLLQCCSARHFGPNCFQFRCFSRKWPKKRDWHPSLGVGQCIVRIKLLSIFFFVGNFDKILCWRPQDAESWIRPCSVLVLALPDWCSGSTTHTTTESAVVDPGFSWDGGTNPPGGANIRFCQSFPKTAWNWKNLDPSHPPPSLDPPMECYIYGYNSAHPQTFDMGPEGQENQLPKEFCFPLRLLRC